MVSAVVLVNTDLGAEAQVLESLKRLEGVEEAQALYSVYDLMVKVKANSVDSLRDIITGSIRRTSGVSTLLTLMLVENQPTQTQTKLTAAPIPV
jgi:DNA-binding Lrp family transcriptional regulator